MITLTELKEKLSSTHDPDDLVELLDISSEQLLDRFDDVLEEKYTGLCEEFEGDEKEESNS